MASFSNALSNSISPDALSNEAAMDPRVCLVCSFDIVTGGYSYDCGHAIHGECFDAFLELDNVQCDTCASAQY